MDFVVFYFLLFGFCFVVGLFFNIFIKLIIFFIAKNLIITYKLNTIESFYYKEKDYATILVFFLFLSQFLKNSKGRKKKYKLTN